VTALEEELRQEIQAAFAARAYPGDEAIVSRLPGGQGQEAEWTWDLFKGKTWQEMAQVGRRRDLRDNVSFLTLDGFVYYLPGFLQLALEADPRLEIGDRLASYLWHHAEEAASRLAPREKRAVVRTLEVLAQEFERRGYGWNDARTALDQYWGGLTDAELGL